MPMWKKSWRHHNRNRSIEPDIIDALSSRYKPYKLLLIESGTVRWRFQPS